MSFINIWNIKNENQPGERNISKTQKNNSIEANQKTSFNKSAAMITDHRIFLPA